MSDDHFQQESPKRFTAAILISSDRAASGEYEDRSGPALKELLGTLGYEVIDLKVIPDETEAITATLQDFINRADYVITSGGTGPAQRDILPEITRTLIHKELPGVTEMLRMKSLDKTPFAIGSRAVCGIAGNSVILNVPGSPSGAVDYITWVEKGMRHILHIATQT